MTSPHLSKRAIWLLDWMRRQEAKQNTAKTAPTARDGQPVKSAS
ncbi:hypothetical protein [Deinococcus peraridilitoris]|uniref:Uncharacterized protein n=1 Tax=Deinococcus peraridilitoris (strain DSM 19664 / LMG 22246 / CIP 109416 / KR-200) TaxID=937777 RepID=L0A2Y2_DEIPD|nr:hypothetical protein [Deinococcus peraridilitoris]AFZ67542.1 hypothetical protein Deipe_2046 [Deinococcus peraridilitoris DSM 19664]